MRLTAVLLLLLAACSPAASTSCPSGCPAGSACLQGLCVLLAGDGAVADAAGTDGAASARDGAADGAPDAACTDGDRDGFCTPADCDDTNSDIHPGAAERCDDRDWNCDGNPDRSDAWCVQTGGPAAAADPAPSKCVPANASIQTPAPGYQQITTTRCQSCRNDVTTTPASRICGCWLNSESYGLCPYPR